jgi:ferrous iron transport protein A
VHLIIIRKSIPDISLQLLALNPRLPAYVDRIDWLALRPDEGERLRELGLCEGASVELLHRGGWRSRGAVACRIGRMTVGMRADHAAAIWVRTGPLAIGPCDDKSGESL